MGEPVEKSKKDKPNKVQPPEVINEEYVAASEGRASADKAMSFGGAPIDPRSLTPGAVLHLQRTIGNQAVQRLLFSSTNAPIIQRDAASDLSEAMMLKDFPKAAKLMEQLSDPDLQAQVKTQPPETLLGLHRAATKANLTRVRQAVQSMQLVAGVEVDRFEGSTFKNPVALFQTGVILYKEVNFIKRGRFKTPADFETFKNRIKDAVRTHITNLYKLRINTPTGPMPGDGEYPIRVEFVENASATYQITLFGQQHGRSGVTETDGRFFELGQAGQTELPETDMAHEGAHVLLGAHDEYADPSFPARPVFTDHSLMGNFPVEGPAQAELKPRHFGALVQLVNSWFPGRSVSIIK